MEQEIISSIRISNQDPKLGLWSLTSIENPHLWDPSEIGKDKERENADLTRCREGV